MPDTEILTPREAAQYRKCSIRKQDRERAEGRGPAYVRIDGRIFYRLADVDRFIAAHVCGGERGTDVASQHTSRRRGRPRKNHDATVAP